MSDIYSTLNDEQKEYFEWLKNGDNVFITGNAGTGKSYLVKAFSEYCKDNDISLVKTAPTGIASNEIGGATIHSQFKLKIGLDFSSPRKAPKFLNSTDVLLIDEISMVRIDVFDKLMKTIALANKSRQEKGRKPIQLIFCGDFFQLAPVITKNDKPHLKEYYECDIKDGYCFQSKFWSAFKVRLANLTKVVRQDDEEFCKALDMCKYGNVDCLKYFREHFSKEPIDNAIWICGRNTTVKKRNDEGLAKVEGRQYISFATYNGNATEKDKLCDDEFVYKVGARVVMLINDIDGLYQNGTVGTITNVIDANSVVVRFDDDRTAIVKKHKFAKTEYVEKTKKRKVLDENGKVITVSEKALENSEVGSAEQFPMRLGYAVTIHKSQGQTYDAMNLEPEIFANGQLYVALSRCKTADKVYVKGSLTNRMVMTSDEVIAFYKNPDDYSFFGKSEELRAMYVPIQYVKKIEKLIKEWKEEEHGA